ncbi:hypothetical protein HYV89_02195 [Candidatus Woesearchaeota archaeon]|nr:hypothetical protein [Candidatus Woesearchaeota archaeon]
MKLPKLKKTNKIGVSFHFGDNYICKLPLDSSLIKNIPKFTDIAMDRNNKFEDQNKLQIELQHLSDLILTLETKKRNN